MGHDIGSGVSFKSICFDFFSTYLGSLVIRTHTSNSFDVITHYCPILVRNINAVKVSFFGQCSKMQLIPIKNFIIQTCFIQFLWFFRLKCWFKGQMISRIHLCLPKAYKLMCLDRNINGNRDVKFLSGIIGHCTEGRISL